MADPTTTPIFNVPTEPKEKKHGTFDNILGFLGDVLTSRLGMGTPYRDARQNEKISEALGSLDENPDEAFKKVARVNGPLAFKLRDQHIDNERLAATQQANRLAQESLIEARRIAAADRARAGAAALMAPLANVPESQRAELYKYKRKQIFSVPTVHKDDDYRMELNSLYPEEYDHDIVMASTGQVVPVAKQRDQEITSKRDAAVNEDRDASRADRARDSAVRAGQRDRALEISARRAASGGGSRKPTNVQSYVGEDGYKRTQRSDGTVVKSPTRVRPTGKAPAPAEGMRRIINGATYEIRGGRPIRVN